MIQHQITNALLRSLPECDYTDLIQACTTVALPLGEVLHEADEPAPYVYFPLSGVISLLTVLENGDAVEVATVGNEGMAEVATYLGLESPTRWLVQVPGEALRFEAGALRDYAAQCQPLQVLLQRYLLTMFILVSQTAACNRRHAIEERCARWLLMTHDRVEGDSFPMTHEFLANMLGAGRPGVSIAMGWLRSAGVLHYRRGRVQIIDRVALEKTACECYGVIVRRFRGNLP